MTLDYTPFETNKKLALLNELYNAVKRKDLF